MKTFTNDMVCHVWANQYIESGKNSGGTIHFEGTKLFSYNTEIAKILDNGIVLVDWENYSSTTESHKRLAIQALQSSMKVFEVPNLRVLDGHRNTNEHKENITHYKQRIKAAAVSLTRARSDTYHKEKLLISLVETTNKYIEALKLRYKPVEMPDLADVVIEDKKERKARKRAKAKRDKKLEVLTKQLAVGWLKGDCRRPHRSSPTLLRVNKEKATVETSKGAEFPIDHGYLALKVINKCVATGTAYLGSTKTIRLGHFKINTIDNKGNVVAGCHKVLIEHIRRIEPEILDWYSDRK